MSRGAMILAMTFAILILASAVPLAGSAPAPAAIGGPSKQTGIGGPAKPTTLMPSQQSGTNPVPPATQNVCVNCVKKTKK
jgi:hypothetical protein